MCSDAISNLRRYAGTSAGWRRQRLGFVATYLSPRQQDKAGLGSNGFNATAPQRILPI
jgi:hypothetical protein